MKKTHLFLSFFLLVTSCDFINGADEMYEAITTEKLDTYTMEPRNKYFKTYTPDRKNKHPKRFDIIEFDVEDEFYDPNDFYSSKERVSRVIALPNEDIELKKGWVYINGVKLEEPFLPDSLRSEDDMPNVHLEKGQYFVMVDCRKMALQDTAVDAQHKAYDSRKLGVIHWFDIQSVTGLK